MQQDILVYSRILGHFEIPKSYRWTESRECWVCENHSYTLFFSSKSICNHFYNKPSTDEKQNCISKIERVNKHYEERVRKGTSNNHNYAGSEFDEICYDAVDNSDLTPLQSKKLKEQAFRNNMLAGQFTNWRCKGLVPIKNFINLLHKNKKPHLKFTDLDKNNYQEELD